MPIITAPPAAPTTPPAEPSRNDPPATFILRADAFLAWFKDLRSSLASFVGWWSTFRSELNASIAQVNNLTGITLRYTFDAATADADPGPGMLRLSSAAQNASTVVRMDLLDANGVPAQQIIDLFGNGANVTKGYLRLQHSTDATRFILLNVASVASPGGYKNVAVSVAAASSVSPFASGDSLDVYFVRNGDALRPRNRIINSSCLVSQYGLKSLAAPGAIYGGCDRYLTSISATTASAAIFQSTSPAPGIGAQGFVQAMTLTTTGATSVSWNQRIEAKHCSDLNGQTVTMSAMVFQNTGTTINFNAVIAKANTLDNFTGPTALVSGPAVAVPSGVPVLVSVTHTLGASDASNGLQVGLNSATVAAISAKNFYTGDWWFDIGSTAPAAPGTANISEELLRDERYYWTAPNAAVGVATSSTVAVFVFPTPVDMRTTPAFTALATTSTFTSNGSTAAIAGTWASSSIGPKGCVATFTRSSGTWTAGDAVVLNDAGNASAPFALSAEL